MGRRPRHTLAILLAAAPLACGDPLIIIGDTPGFMRLVAGVADAPGLEIADLATQTRLTDPLAVLMNEADGDLIVLDQGATLNEGGITRRGARMFIVHPDNTIDDVFTDGGCRSGVCIHEPVQLAWEPHGTMLIADLNGNRLVRSSGDLRALSTVAGTGRLDTSPDGTPAQAAFFRGVSGVAVAPDGRIYFSEVGSHRIRTIDEDGTIRTIAGIGLEGSSGDGGPATAARLSAPRGLALSDATLYIAETGAHVVRAIDLQSGIIRTVAGTPGVRGYLGDGGPAVGARLDRPVSVAVAADDETVYVADEGNHAVRVISLATGAIDTFAGTGAAGYNGSGRPAGETLLRVPATVAASGRGFLLIADREQHVVWRTSIRLTQ